MLGKSLVLLLGTIDGTVAGATFLHHIVAHPTTQAPMHASADLYILRAYRGPQGLQLGHALKQCVLERMGFSTFYSTIHVDHKASQHYAGKLGMFRCGVVPCFLPMNGTLADVVLYAALPPQSQEAPHGG